MVSGQWSDDPIKSRSADEFERALYADGAAALIAASHSWESSVVFGLTGPWGSGKSSLVEMIAESLKAQDDNWVVVRFTPWATGDVTGLLGEFYSSLMEALPARRHRVPRHATRAIGTLVQIAAPAAGLIPVAGGSVADVLKDAGGRLASPPSWDKAFKKAAKELKDLRLPVLIVADDIDRLQTEELLALLKVVRLLGRFPGVQYLLAYDERTLSRALETASLVGEGNGAAERFMEKIVQYPLVVPPLLQYQLLRRLNEGISQVLTDTARTHVDSHRLGRVGDLFPRQLWTPRGIDRFLAQIRHHLPMVDSGEIDDVDAILLIMLRVAFPGVFGELPQWRSVLLTGHSGELSTTEGELGYVPADWESLVDLAPHSGRVDTRSLLMELFPSLRTKGSVYFSSVGERRISNEDYFDRYFAMGVPAHDVRDETVRRAVDEARSGSEVALRSLLLDPEPAKAYLAVTKGRQLSDEGFEDADRLALVKTLANVVDEMSEAPALIVEPKQQAVQWIADLLNRLGAEGPADDIDDALTPISLGTKLEVWRGFVERSDWAPAIGWPVELSQRMVDRAIAAFMHNVVDGDGAADDPAGWYCHFAMTYGGLASLRAKVEEALDSQQTSLADLAARMVSIRSLALRADRSIGDFGQEAWNRLAIARDDPWYTLEREHGIDRADARWANRRRYAQGRVRRPNHAPGEEESIQ